MDADDLAHDDPLRFQGSAVLGSFLCGRFSSSSFSSRRSGIGALVFANQRTNALGNLRALGLPLGDLVQIQLQGRFLAACNRIEETETFNVTAIAAVTAVRRNNVVEGTLLGAAAGQSDLDHGKSWENNESTRLEPRKGRVL